MCHFSQFNNIVLITSQVNEISQCTSVTFKETLVAEAIFFFFAKKKTDVSFEMHSFKAKNNFN